MQKESNTVSVVDGRWKKSKQVIKGILIVAILASAIKYLVAPSYNENIYEYLVANNIVKDEIIKGLVSDNLLLKDKLRKKGICS